MFTQDQKQIFLQFISIADSEAQNWMHGYLSALISKAQENVNNSNFLIQQTSPSNIKLNVVYGTDTGNAKKIAQQFVQVAKQKNIITKATNLDQYKLSQLPKEDYLIIIISTQGEGEAPESAKKFYDHIHQENTKLNNLKFAVLALGDTSYPLYCKAGEDVDIQLKKMGATSIFELQKCDVDFETIAQNWTLQILNLLIGKKPESTIIAAKIAPDKNSKSKVNFNGTVLSHTNLNDEGSSKATYHIEISAENIDYEPGDSLGIVPYNNKQIVKDIISITKFDANQKIEHKNNSNSLEIMLEKHFNITYLLPTTIEEYAKISGHVIKENRCGLLYLLKKYPLKNDSDFLLVLQKLSVQSPRLYSISSSPKAHKDEVHITVALDTFYIEEKLKFGLCSNFLSQQNSNTTLDVFIQKNRHFKLPHDDKNIIMIGPGTGIAPFRAFLSERASTGASGKNWLFFGEQHANTDFLYQTEIQAWVAEGVLTKIDIAFSRDQKEKIYVQNLMLQKASEFFKWIQNGAYIYVCGKKNPMSKDVELVLLQILQTQGNMNEEQAKEYLEKMSDEHKYLKDVY